MSKVSLKRGASFDLDVTHLDSSGAPIDITGYSINSQARTTVDAENTLFDLSIGSGVTIVDGPNGQANLYVQNTTAWEPREYVFDIDYIEPSGRVVSSSTMILEIVPDVTR